MSEIKPAIHIDGNEAVIRTGSALPLKEPNIIQLSGDIHTVGAFLKKRFPSVVNIDALPENSGRQAVASSKSVVEFDRKNRTVILKLDPEDFYGATVTGKLEDADELEPFHINGRKMFSRKELVDIIRFNRMLFPDKEAHAKVLAAYQDFTYTANTEGKASSDTRGNVAAAIDKKVKTNLPEEFTLTAPIFKGLQPSTFRVMIGIDVTDGGAKFWLESVELIELEYKLTDDLFDEQRTYCEGLVIINK